MSTVNLFLRQPYQPVDPYYELERTSPHVQLKMFQEKQFRVNLEAYDRRELDQGCQSGVVAMKRAGQV